LCQVGVAASREEQALKCTNQRNRRMVVLMSEMTVSDARARLADVVDSARVEHNPVYLTRRGQRVAAVIDADDLDRLIAAAEDLADLEDAAAARAEMADGHAPIPWEQVKADLGLA
jgi:antitoxin Phd